MSLGLLKISDQMSFFADNCRLLSDIEEKVYYNFQRVLKRFSSIESRFTDNYCSLLSKTEEKVNYNFQRVLKRFSSIER